MARPEQDLSRRRILALAWPVILANAAVPLLGLVDTAVIGRYGSPQDLGAIAVGAVIFSFVYWSFGFLRMSTTGFVAQAAGADNEPEVRATLGRALLTSTALGLLLIALQWPISYLALLLMDTSESVTAITADYFRIRIWGAPAALGLFALMGLLIGLRQTRALLAAQLLLNGLNITLDVIFAGVFGWGAAGIALGTALAEWTTLIVVGAWVVKRLRQRAGDHEPLFPRTRVFDRERLAGLLSANFDIMLRTLLLTFSFAWFVRQSAGLGDAVLAANHILLQFVSFSAFFLDGYAFVAEALVGEALGRRNRKLFDLAVRRSTELAAATALALAVLLLLAGNTLIHLLTVHEPVQAAAATHLPWVGLYVLLSFAAFQLDGVFIGATRTRAMRNASAASVAVYLPAAWLLLPAFGSHGLWGAFVIYVCARALALLWAYPSLRASVSG